MVAFSATFVIFPGPASFPSCHVTILTMRTSKSMLCQLRMCNRFSNILHFGGLFPCFCDCSRSSLVSMLQDQGPGIKPPLMVEDLIFRGGNRNILNQDAKTNISSYVSCFYPKCLAKMKNKPFLRQCLLTISPERLRSANHSSHIRRHLQPDERLLVEIQPTLSLA